MKIMEDEIELHLTGKCICLKVLIYYDDLYRKLLQNSVKVTK